MKNALTFWKGGKLRRSALFVVPPVNKSLSPIGAAYSELFSNEAALGRSSDSLWFNNFTEDPALTGLASRRWFKRFPFKVSQGHSRLLKGIQACSRVFEKISFYFYERHMPSHMVSQAGSSLCQGESSQVKLSQAVWQKKRLFISCRAEVRRRRVSKPVPHPKSTHCRPKCKPKADRSRPKNESKT